MPHPTLAKVIIVKQAFEIMAQKAGYLCINRAWYSAPYDTFELSAHSTGHSAQCLLRAMTSPASLPILDSVMKVVLEQQRRENKGEIKTFRKVIFYDDD